VESWEIGEPIQRYLSENEETKLRKVLNRWVEKCAPHHRLKRLYLRSHAIELTVAICTGMRKGNQYRFRWSNVDFESRTIYLPKSETKQGRAHVLPMIDDVYNALIELRQIQDEIASIRGERDGGKKVQRIRMQSGGRVFDIAEPREWWAKAVKEAKIPHIRWHDLRHTTASRMVQSRKTLKEAGDALGHSSPNTTQRYAHLDVSHLHDAMSVLNTGRHNQTA
jgi:integrase